MESLGLIICALIASFGALVGAVAHGAHAQEGNRETARFALGLFVAFQIAVILTAFLAGRT